MKLRKTQQISLTNIDKLINTSKFNTDHDNKRGLITPSPK